MSTTEQPMQPFFPTTIWIQIREAQKGDRAGMNDLLARYRGALLGYLRRKGLRPDHAEDMAQEVLLRVAQPGFLKKADSAKGRFRTLLLAVTRRVLSEHRRWEHAGKRGGHAAIMNTREMSLTETNVFDRVSADDPEFDQLWVAEIVERALADLKEDSNKRGLPLAEAFRLKYLENLSQEEVARKLGCDLSNTKNHIHYGKLKFKQLVLKAIRAYCSSNEEFDEELKLLAPYLKVKGA